MKMESSSANLIEYYRDRMRQSLAAAEKSKSAAYARRDYLHGRTNSQIHRGLRTTLGGDSQTIRDRDVQTDTLYKAHMADVTWFLHWANAYANAIQAELKLLEHREPTAAGIWDADPSRAE